jgi:preflagellin peptidase FlaK
VKYAVAVSAVIALAYLWVDKAYFQHLLAVPVIMLAVVGMYMLDIIRGGADAKALMSLAILFPSYPIIGGLPVLLPETELATIVFPFAFVVLIAAAIIVAVVMPLVFLAVNIAARDLRFPNALFGRAMDLEEARGKHVWLMERVQDGSHMTYTRPRRDENLSKELDHLKSIGVSRVWVTPKIPFMVPMLAGILISATAGNLLLLLFPI